MTRRHDALTDRYASCVQSHLTDHPAVVQVSSPTWSHDISDITEDGRLADDAFPVTLSFTIRLDPRVSPPALHAYNTFLTTHRFHEDWADRRRRRRQTTAVSDRSDTAHHQLKVEIERVFHSPTAIDAVADWVEQAEQTDDPWPNLSETRRTGSDVDPTSDRWLWGDDVNDYEYRS